MVLKNEFLEAVRDADLVIEDGNDTLVCYRSRKPFEGEPEDADIWKIKLYRVVETKTGKVTMLLYPYGSADYRFAPNKVGEYTFTYVI